ncbi:hypothetical protein ACSBR2_030016 [Camellia fascicularis]
MAHLFPPWNPSFRPRLLLVLPLLPLLPFPLPPHFPHLLLHPPRSPPLILPPLQPLNSHLHVLLLARILNLFKFLPFSLPPLFTLLFMATDFGLPLVFPVGVMELGHRASVLSAAILLLFLNFYVKMHLGRRKVADFDAIKDGDVDTDMAKNKDI